MNVASNPQTPEGQRKKAAAHFIPEDDITSNPTHHHAL